MRIGNSQNNNWVQENNEMVKNCGPGILSLNAKTSCSDLFWFGGDRNVDKTNLIFQICFDSEELSGNRWWVINLLSSCLYVVVQIIKRGAVIKFLFNSQAVRLNFSSNFKNSVVNYYESWYLHYASMWFCNVEDEISLYIQSRHRFLLWYLKLVVEIQMKAEPSVCLNIKVSMN